MRAKHGFSQWESSGETGLVGVERNGHFPKILSTRGLEMKCVLESWQGNHRGWLLRFLLGDLRLVTVPEVGVLKD